MIALTGVLAGGILLGMLAAIPPGGRPTSTPERPAAAPIQLDALFPVVYDELRRVAHRQLGAEATGHTLNTTALVHEIYLRLNSGEARFADRAHFFAVAARAMRHVLVDCARRFRSTRRGGGVVPLALDDRDVSLIRAEEMLDLDEALSRLELLVERQAQVVEYRFFAGLSEAETAALLGITERTVRRDWVRARAWLYDALRPPA
jgi:RNA polymerase sigma factor (TIGR02999 family)